MWAITDIERIFNNQSVGAFLGAMVAFFLVMFTDWRRNRRKARNLMLEVESARFHAEQKRTAVIAIREDMRKLNRVSPGRFIRFNSGLLRHLEGDVLDQLTPEQRRAIDAITFRMEGCDQILEDAHVHARAFGDPKFQTGRAEKAGELLGVLEDAIVNLGVLMEMCEQFEKGQFADILTAQHDRSKYIPDDRAL